MSSRPPSGGKERREPSFERGARASGGRGGGLRADPEARAPRAKAPAKPRKAGRGWFARASWFVLKWSFVVGIWAGIAGAGVLGYFALTLPPVDRIERFERRPSLTFVDARGETVATYGDLFGGLVRLEEMPPWLPMAVLATEDRRFYTHFGIDLRGIARAALANFQAGRVVQGGSTITQQLAKNVFLDNDRSAARKIREAMLAIWLERNFTKDQILTLYLNRVYLGAGTYGVEAAARRYFGKSARQVNAHEAAIVAGLLKAPSRLAPTANMARAKTRAAEVLDNMVEAGFMTAEQRAGAGALPVAVPAAAQAERGNRYFTDWLLERVQSFVGYADRDLTVVTTMDLRLQRAVEAALEDMLAREGPRADVEQGAMVIMSPDGAVRALTGGRDYAKSQYNRATEARRQPGSAFKTFVYLAAVERGLKADDLVLDAPIKIRDWQPRNFDGRFGGEIPVRDAFARSVNTAAVRIAQQAGVDNVIRTAQRLGIESPLRRDLSIALGTSEVSLMELTAAYAPLANGGNGVIPYAILEIRDAAGGVLYRRQGSGPGAVMSRAALATMTDLTMANVRVGSGRAANIDRPAGGKTGTTQDYRDAWFVGYTADYVAGVWFGNDDRDDMERITGGTLPARLWRSVMLEAHRGLPARPLPGQAPAEERGWFARLFQASSPASAPPATAAPAQSRPVAAPPARDPLAMPDSQGRFPGEPGYNPHGPGN
jgi:penicillin-binding protein 1A